MIEMGMERQRAADELSWRLKNPTVPFVHTMISSTISHYKVPCDKCSDLHWIVAKAFRAGLRTCLACEVKEVKAGLEAE